MNYIVIKKIMKIGPKIDRGTADLNSQLPKNKPAVFPLTQ